MLPTFKNSQLLQTALSHRSILNESATLESNERMEFLGDAVLELITTEWLYKRFPQEQEGKLTSFRASLVKTTTLSTISKELGLDDMIKMSNGEEHSGGRSNVGILADTFEAFLGALYLDQGFEACKNFVSAVLFPHFDEILELGLYRDYKSSLQELVQSQGKSTPVYRTVSESGPDHMKTFLVEVSVDDQTLGSGSGKSKQDASAAAAKTALEKLGGS
ncbi:MAG TPA: ribonuclease III [Patescibacteria group bacterium]|nr:ribonuclease III [Patescibacteria group bacterium]